MKTLLKLYWFDIALVLGFVVFTFIIPVKIVSLATAVILAVGLIQMVLNDERIQRPYSSILAIMIFIACGLFMNMYW